MTLFLAALFLTATLDTTPFMVEADKAVSLQGQLALSGHVKISSGLMAAQAEEASCAQNKQGALTLVKDVRLDLVDYGSIACDKAILELSRAQFFSEDKPVVYRDEKNELNVSARQMSLAFVDKKVQKFAAQESVMAQWQKDISCEAADAELDTTSRIVTFRQAHIIAKGRSDLHCAVAAFNTKTHAVILEQVQGAFGEQRQLFADADTMSYTDFKGLLTGHVRLRLPLHTGEAVMTSIDSCLIDDKRSTVTLLPAAGARILLEAPYGTLKAGSIDLVYEKEENDYRLRLLFLKGDVEISNTSSFKDVSQPVNRYALADMVEVDCYEKLMTMKALNNKRVLFYDEEKKVQVSADAVAVCYKNGQEEISGKGAVRMLFDESELCRLSEHFHK